MSSAFKHWKVEKRGITDATVLGYFYFVKYICWLSVKCALLLSYSHTLQLLSLDHCCGAGRQTQSPLFQEIYTAGEAHASEMYCLLFAHWDTQNKTRFPKLILKWRRAVCRVIYLIQYASNGTGQRRTCTLMVMVTSNSLWLWCGCLLLGALAVSPQSKQSQRI